MKKIIVIIVIAVLCLVGLTAYKTITPESPELYDTIYVVSEYRYFVVDDSTLRKKVVADTIHSLDLCVPEMPVSVVRILRVDTIK